MPPSFMFDNMLRHYVAERGIRHEQRRDHLKASTPRPRSVDTLEVCFCRVPDCARPEGRNQTSSSFMQATKASERRSVRPFSAVTICPNLPMMHARPPVGDRFIIRPVPRRVHVPQTFPSLRRSSIGTGPGSAAFCSRNCLTSTYPAASAVEAPLRSDLQLTSLLCSDAIRLEKELKALQNARLRRLVSEARAPPQLRIHERWVADVAKRSEQRSPTSTIVMTF